MLNYTLECWGYIFLSWLLESSEVFWGLSPANAFWTRIVCGKHHLIHDLLTSPCLSVFDVLMMYSNFEFCNKVRGILPKIREPFVIQIYWPHLMDGLMSGIVEIWIADSNSDMLQTWHFIFSSMRASLVKSLKLHIHTHAACLCIFYNLILPCLTLTTTLSC